MHRMKTVLEVVLVVLFIVFLLIAVTQMLRFRKLVLGLEEKYLRSPLPPGAGKDGIREARLDSPTGAFDGNTALPVTEEG